MVQATTSKNGSVNLESILQITEGQKCAIMRNLNKVKNILKDLHAAHAIAANEDGTPISRLRKSIEGSFDPLAEANNLHADHKLFLNTVDKWLEDRIEEPEVSTALDEPALKEASEEDDNEPMMVLIAIPVMIV